MGLLSHMRLVILLAMLLPRISASSDEAVEMFGVANFSFSYSFRILPAVEAANIVGYRLEMTEGVVDAGFLILFALKAQRGEHEVGRFPLDKARRSAIVKELESRGIRVLKDMPAALDGSPRPRDGLSISVIWKDVHGGGTLNFGPPPAHVLPYTHYITLHDFVAGLIKDIAPSISVPTLKKQGGE